MESVENGDATDIPTNAALNVHHLLLALQPCTPRCPHRLQFPFSCLRMRKKPKIARDQIKRKPVKTQIAGGPATTKPRRNGSGGIMPN